jgi:hypothetical protein
MGLDSSIRACGPTPGMGIAVVFGDALDVTIAATKGKVAAWS